MAEQDKKKWIFIGCGGCLVLVIVVLVILGVAGTTLFGKLQEGSKQTEQAIFGEEYTVPARYTAMGMSVGEGDQAQNILTLMDLQNEIILFAMKMPASDAEVRVLTSNDPATLKTYMEKVGEEMARSSSQNSSQAKDLAIDEVHVMQLANGKMVPVAYIRSQEGSKQAPGAMLVVPQSEGKQAMIFGISGDESLSGTAFEEKQHEIEDELLSIIEASQIDDRIP